MMTRPEYRAALQAIHTLMATDPDIVSPLGRALDDLVAACEEYEKQFFFATPTPEDLAAFRRKEAGL